MPELVRRHWEANSTGPTRRSRMGFDYDAFVPDPIATTEWQFGSGTVATLDRAALASVKMERRVGGTMLEAVSRVLLRAESVASSRIEGLEVSNKRLAQALFDPEGPDHTAKLVMANVRAMEKGLALSRDEPITTEMLCQLHGVLLQGENPRLEIGSLRSQPVWIGGRLPSPLDAEFVPPPADRVRGLMDDLVAFCARDDVPGLAQAAIAHAQFETIHPFLDGNGRIGRCLIHMVMQRRGLADRVVPPVSQILAASGPVYVDGLTAYRAGEVEEWCEVFAGAVERASDRTEALAETFDALRQKWSHQVGPGRSDASVYRLIESLPWMPVLDVDSAAQALDRARNAITPAIGRLEAVGILSPLKQGAKRGRVWGAEEVFSVLDEFEWELGTPAVPGLERRHTPRRPTRKRFELTR